MDRQQTVKAFNEWMRRYTDDRASFDADWNAVVAKFVKEDAAGREPSYGEICVAYLESLIATD